MRWSLWVILLGVAGFAAFVRLAPSDPARWHVALDFDANTTDAVSASRVFDGDAARFDALDAIVRAEPRTQLLAGSAESGHVTYVTRSALWGFPDYVTLQRTDGQIRVFSRLRFGKADLGVNAARVDRWLEALGQG
ncbi:DUF1499 domain-containing protein [Primorskyibacter sp. S187A]|uniref:DUF1499 domain-containing protein n=1 Tax=Primorskyibacter sp. S187A TaxID=3415130 RepID=UPI003C7AF93C